MCVHVPQATAYRFLYMTLAIDTVNGRGLSNKVHRELLSKKSNCINHSFHSISHLTSCTLLALQFLKWACCAGCEVYKSRLAYSVTVRISG